MSREKFLTVAVVFLLALNVGIIGYLFFSRPPRPPELWKMVVERVEFDEQQTNQYFLLRNEHRAGMDILDEAFAGVLNQFLAQLKSTPDSVLEASLSSQLAEIEKQKAEHTLNHFRQVKALCKPEQVKKFEALVPQLMPILLPPKNPHPKKKR